MQSTFTRAALGIAVVALAVVLLIVLEDSGDGGSDGGNGGSDAGGLSRASGGGGNGEADGGGGETQGAALAVPTVVVENGAPVGGVRTLTYIKGDQIRFQVASDVADEVHVHGYDLTEDVAAGGSARFDFPAELEGIFEVELEGRGEQIAELRVSP